MNGERVRTVTIRWSIFRNLIFLVALIALAISVSTLIIGNQSAEQFSRHIMGQASDLAASSIEPIFEAAQNTLLLFRQFGQQGLLQPGNPLVMNLMFIPFMTSFPEISSINTGDAEGNGYLILRSGDGWRNRIVTAEGVGRTTLWMDWSRSGKLLREYSKDIDYDPRTRPWYVLARQRHTAGDAAVAWTPPYQLFTTKDIGITAAVTVPRENDAEYVLAFDMLLTDISHITGRIKPSENGLVALLTGEGRVVGMPRPFAAVTDEDRLKELLLKPVAEIGMPALSTAFDQWRATDGAPYSTFQLDHAGGSWWVDVRPLRLAGNGPSMYLIVMVPEYDFMGSVYQSEILIGVITAGAIGLALLMAVLLARSYGEPLERLVRESERIRNLELESTAAITSKIREVEYLADAHDRMKNVLGSFARYVPVDLVRTLLVRGEAAHLGGMNKVVTVLFTDIEGFGSVAESMTPEALTQHLAEYFDNMILILKAEQATIDKFVGDAIVAFWNAPNDVPDHAGHAVVAALRCRDRLMQLNAEWKARGLPPLPTRFGINTGSVMVGNVGAESRLNYTVVGDVVNLASRIEGLNRLYGTTLLVSEQVRNDVGARIVWRHVDRVAVKGKLQGVDVFEPLGQASEVLDEHRVFAEKYEEALEHYLDGGFAHALREFRSLLEDYPGDRSVKLMIESCEAFSLDPPENWDGIRRLEVK